MKITKTEAVCLKEEGYSAEDIAQIRRLKYRFDHDGVELSFERARNLAGKAEMLSGLGRAAFHGTAVRGDGKKKVFIRSSLFGL
jgi:hypothetical protein